MRRRSPAQAAAARAAEERERERERALGEGTSGPLLSIGNPSSSTTNESIGGGSRAGETSIRGILQQGGGGGRRGAFGTSRRGKPPLSPINRTGAGLGAVGRMVSEASGRPLFPSNAPSSLHRPPSPPLNMDVQGFMLGGGQGGGGRDISSHHVDQRTPKLMSRAQRGRFVQRIFQHTPPGDTSRASDNQPRLEGFGATSFGLLPPLPSASQPSLVPPSSPFNPAPNNEARAMHTSDQEADISPSHLMLAAEEVMAVGLQPSLRRSLSAGMHPPLRRILPPLNPLTPQNESVGGAQRSEGYEYRQEADDDNVMMASVVMVPEEASSSSQSGFTNESLLLLGGCLSLDHSPTANKSISSVKWKLFENPMFKDSVASSRESISR